MLLSAGQGDPTFGDTGKVLLPLASDFTVNAVALQKDGKIVLAGAAPPGSSNPAGIGSFFLERLNVDGTLDTSFGAKGVVTTSFGRLAIARAIMIQADGKIVAGGVNATGLGVPDQFALARYNADGSLDSSFGTAGKVITSLLGNAELQSLAIAPDGKLLAAGPGIYQDPAHPTDSNYAAEVFDAVRYNTNGTLDTTFNGTGYVYHQLDQQAGGFFNTVAVTAQPDGKVLVGSGFKQDFAVWRYTTAGALDPTFGLGGMATTPFFYADLASNQYDYGSVSQIVVQPDGKVLVAGPDNRASGQLETWAMSRFNPDGSPDGNFGVRGMVSGGLTPNTGAVANPPGGLALQSDGKILIGGVDALQGTGNRGPFLVKRYLPSGAPDPEFASTDQNFFVQTLGSSGAMALGADGKIVVAGNVSAGNVQNGPLFAGVVRLQGDAAMIGPTPFLGHPFNISTDRIEAENFDNGGEGVSYHDTTPQNLGGAYRNTAVDIGADSTASNGFAVGYTAPGEWLDYTVTVPTAGNYVFQAQVAAFQPGGTFHMEIDGVNETGAIKVPNSGPWDTWVIVSSGAFNLAAGTHVMRIQMDTGGFYGEIGDFDYFKFAAAPAPAAATAASPGPGTLDSTFGLLGRQLYNDPDPISLPDSLQHRVKAVAVQSDGRIVLAGSIGTRDNNGTGQFYLERLNADGSVDPSFGSNGQVETSFGPISYATSILIEANGTILVGGGSQDPGSALKNVSFALARYTVNGSLDATFGSGGKVVTSFPGSGPVESLALSPNGKIVAAGSFSQNSAAGFNVARYNADGSPDTSFNASGMVSYDLGPTSDNSFPAALAVQSDGKVVIGAHAGSEFGLYRFNVDGSADHSFGSSGIVATGGATSGAVTALAIQSDGKIIAAGRTPFLTQEYELARFGTDGSLDSTFGSQGVMAIGTLPIGGVSYPLAGLLLQSDGKILLVGTQHALNSIEPFPASQLLVRRLLPDGKPDTTFQADNDPNYVPPPPYGGPLAEAVALAPDGSLVVAGDVWADNQPNSPHWLGLARYVTGASVNRLPGDANGDGTVDFKDLVILAQYYGKTSGALWNQGDFDGDGKVDFNDLVILAANYGKTTAAAKAATVRT